MKVEQLMKSDESWTTDFKFSNRDKGVKTQPVLQNIQVVFYFEVCNFFQVSISKKIWNPFKVNIIPKL